MRGGALGATRILTRVQTLRWIASALFIASVPVFLLLSNVRVAALEPRVSEYSFDQYDVETVAKGPIADGVAIERIHYRNGAPACSLRHFHYEKATYEAALRDAGFTDISWNRFVLAAGADRTCPPGYWDAFLGEFSIAVLVCRL